MKVQINMRTLQRGGQGQGSTCQHPQLWSKQETAGAGGEGAGGAERVLQSRQHDCRFVLLPGCDL